MFALPWHYHGELTSTACAPRHPGVGHQPSGGSAAEQDPGLRGGEDRAGEPGPGRSIRHDGPGCRQSPGPPHCGQVHRYKGQPHPPALCMWPHPSALSAALCVRYQCRSPSLSAWVQGSLTGSGRAVHPGLWEAGQDREHSPPAREDGGRGVHGSSGEGGQEWAGNGVTVAIIV